MSQASTLILHIGTPKTGTTSIQEFLHANRSIFADQGIAIPQLLGAKNHRWLAILSREVHKDASFGPLKGVPSDQIEAIKKTKAEELRAFVRKTGVPKYVASSEFLAALNQREIHRLKNLLSGIFTNIEILVYIRSPIGLAISAMGERLKRGDIINSLPHPSEVGMADHRKLIQKWSNGFGADKINVRILEKNFLINSDLIADFIAQVGAKIDPASTRSLVKNEALSFPALKILSHMNSAVPRIPNSRNNPARRTLISALTTHFSSFPKYQPSLAEQQSFEAYFAPVTNWLQENYFPDRDPLWSPVTTRESHQSANPFELDESEHAFAKVILALVRSQSRSQDGPTD